MQAITPPSRKAATTGTLLGAALALAVLLAPAARVPAQSGQWGTASQSYPRPRVGQDPISPLAGDDGDPVMQEKRLNALNAERQKSLVSDTNKLVKLVAELNAEINGPHPASLTDEQVKKLAEIEKLAHSIREKMSSPVNGIPQMNAPAVIIPPGMQ